MKIIKKIFLMLFVFFVGILTVNAESKNIKVTSVTVKEKSTTIEVADPVISDNEITSNITFNQLNDYVTFELTLKNNESDKYKITSITDNNTSNNIEVEYDYPEDFISSNDEAKVRVKLTYKSQLTNSNISLDNLTITFNVENESGETNQIVLNPNTGDNVLHYLVLLIIAITGLILITRKKKVKIGALVLALGIIIIPFAVLAEEKLAINFKFSNIEVKGEFKDYNVTVDKGDGSEPTTLSITYGETIGELPVAPAKEGHTFVGWIDEQNREVTEDTVITGPLNITPVYKKDKHQLTITHPEYLNEGNISGQYEYGTQITLTAKTRNGFTFSKWSDNSTDNPKTITIGTSDITIEPIYSRNKYVITFNPNGGTVNVESKEIDTGAAVGTLPTPTYIGYEFLGWYTEQEGGTQVTNETIPTDTTTYYAHWKVLDRMIYYNDLDNNGEISFGDYVKFGDDGFYVISSPADGKVQLITEYNLDSNFRQSTDSYYVSFSDYNFWFDSAASSSDDYADLSGLYRGYNIESGTAYVYRDKNGNNTDNNIYEYIEEYKSHLEEDLEIENIYDARLLSLSEANQINTMCGSYNCAKILGYDYFWIGNTYYSLGSYFDGYIDYVQTMEYWNETVYISSSSYSSGNQVRPIIEIDTSLLTASAFEMDSWSTIVENIANGNDLNYRVGDSKTVKYNNLDYRVRLVNKTTPDECNAEGFSQTACGYVIEFEEVVAVEEPIVSSETNDGGWASTDMVAWLNGDFYNSLPEDLKNVIIPTYPIVSSSGSTNNSPDITASDTNKNKIYILSPKEIGFEEENDNKRDKTRTLDYYLINNNNLARRKKDIIGDEKEWWLRSAPSDNTENYFSVWTYGDYGEYSLRYRDYYYGGTSPVFRIGKNS